MVLQIEKSENNSILEKGENTLPLERLNSSYDTVFSQVSATSSTKRCDHCQSINLVESAGFVVCNDCAVVNDRVVYNEASFLSDDDNNSLKHHNISNSAKYYGSLGSRLSRSISGKYSRLSKLHFRMSLDYTSTHIHSFSVLDLIINRINQDYIIPDYIREETTNRYLKIANNTDKRITNHILLMATCFLKSLRYNKIPVKFTTVVRLFNEMGHQVSNSAVNRMAYEFDINFVTVKTPDDYAERILSMITDDEEIQSRTLERYNLSIIQYGNIMSQLVIDILELFGRKPRMGRDPFIFASTGFYIADKMISEVIRGKSRVWNVLSAVQLARIIDGKKYTTRLHMKQYGYDFIDTNYDTLTELAQNYIKEATK